MKIKLNFREIEQLKKIDFLGRGAFIKVEMNENVIKYCKKVIENDYKFQEGLLHEPSKIKEDTLYKKLCKSIE